MNFMSLDIIRELADSYSTTDSAKAVAYYQQALTITKEKNYRSYELDLNNKGYKIFLYCIKGKLGVHKG